MPVCLVVSGVAQGRSSVGHWNAFREDVWVEEREANEDDALDDGGENALDDSTSSSMPMRLADIRECNGILLLL